jgi:hypothetical protein
MYTAIESKQIFLNPKGATIQNNGRNYSSLRFNLPNLIKNNTNELYNTIKVSHCEIPYSFYILNSNNNQLNLSSGNITIESGNYNVNSFMEYIKTNYSNLITVTFSILTGRLTLTSTEPFNILGSSTIGNILGFENGLNYMSDNNNKIVLPYPANFIGAKNLYIKCPNLILNNYDSVTRTENTLCSIPISVPPYSLIIYDNDDEGSIIENKQINYLDIEISDELAQLVNFHNIDWNITITIKTIVELNKIKTNNFDDYLSTLRNDKNNNNNNKSIDK